MDESQRLVAEMRQKLLDSHLGKGPLPTWAELYQAFCAADDLLQRDAVSATNGTGEQS